MLCNFQFTSASRAIVFNVISALLLSELYQISRVWFVFIKIILN